MTRSAASASASARASGGPVTSARSPDVPRDVEVSGHGVHHASTSVVHDEAPTTGGTVRRSTDVVRLEGDLDGFLLYQPVSTVDDAAGTLVNTGIQFFSGTIAGTGPVALQDDTFRFEVDLTTGATVGEVHLRPLAGPPRDGPGWACDLSVVGTGVTPAGDPTVRYRGRCTWQAQA